MTGLYLFFIAIGVFFVAAAVFNWDSWFIDRESRLIEAIGGEGLVRWYWAILGLVIIIASLVYWAKAG
jgi:hypothetical protein